MKVCIAGSRGFTDESYLIEKVNQLIEQGNITEPFTLICGMARGADITGYNVCKDNDIEIIEYPADWNTHGKSAGYIRNREMADVCDCAVIFWDGLSVGTANMIKLMRNRNKPVYVFKYLEE